MFSSPDLKFLTPGELHAAAKGHGWPVGTVDEILDKLEQWKNWNALSIGCFMKGRGPSLSLDWYFPRYPDVRWIDRMLTENDVRKFFTDDKKCLGPASDLSPFNRRAYIEQIPGWIGDLVLEVAPNRSLLQQIQEGRQ